ncbi:hypothetical protein QBC46DRAFT_375938 [Diplogelasinospora grovesii]|uniref:Transmembrane protein n=1 Tax=Diplogelasinospora grovesii TaxID=303347 RepID=A0AAN6NHW1_9PEZI|nr:hypothetical protein QBC46DRAFT_375938 [Diplogelasinospora grovesii]
MEQAFPPPSFISTVALASVFEFLCASIQLLSITYCIADCFLLVIVVGVGRWLCWLHYTVGVWLQKFSWLMDPVIQPTPLFVCTSGTNRRFRRQ